MRNEFAALLSERADHNKTMTSIQAEIDTSFAATVRSEWQDRFPNKRGKFSLTRAMGDFGAEEYERIRQQHWTEFCQPRADAFRDKQKELERQLDELAEKIVPQPGDEWNLWRDVSTSSYGSQGYGATHYAKAAAENTADTARMYRLEADVRPRYSERTPRDMYAGGAVGFGVWVKASVVDLAILDRKPGPGLREWVRLCWARGVNPRVYNPWLPFGYEEQAGLDYFGGERSLPPHEDDSSGIGPLRVPRDHDDEDDEAEQDVTDPYCACGRRQSDCNGSQPGCVRTAQDIADEAEEMRTAITEELCAWLDAGSPTDRRTGTTLAVLATTEVQGTEELCAWLDTPAK